MALDVCQWNSPCVCVCVDMGLLWLCKDSTPTAHLTPPSISACSSPTSSLQCAATISCWLDSLSVPRKNHKMEYSLKGQKWPSGSKTWGRGAGLWVSSRSLNASIQTHPTFPLPPNAGNSQRFTSHLSTLSSMLISFRNRFPTFLMTEILMLWHSLIWLFKSSNSSVLQSNRSLEFEGSAHQVPVFGGKCLFFLQSLDLSFNHLGSHSPFSYRSYEFIYYLL